MTPEPDAAEMLPRAERDPHEAIADVVQQDLERQRQEFTPEQRKELVQLLRDQWQEIRSSATGGTSAALEGLKQLIRDVTDTDLSEEASRQLDTLINGGNGPARPPEPVPGDAPRGAPAQETPPEEGPDR